MTKTTVAILLFDDVEELDAVGPYQVFGTASAKQPELFRVFTVAADSSRPVRAVNGLRMLADFSTDTAPPFDVLLIPGGVGTRRVADTPELVQWVRRRAAASRMVASVCSGARVTLAAGLAAGKRITTHWGVVDELRRQGEAAEVLDDVRFVRDGDIVHAAGVSAGIDMSLWLVGLFASPSAAREVQREIEYYPAPPFAYDASL